MLIEAGLLTRFQAEQTLQGKWRGFTLGKYSVLERLGSGGMGTVYLCEHLSVRRRVAIKVLPNSQADNPSALGRFYREARAAGILDHPNLVKAHDIDQDNGLHFLVMDYVDGSNLQRSCRVSARSPSARAQLHPPGRPGPAERPRGRPRSPRREAGQHPRGPQRHRARPRPGTGPLLPGRTDPLTLKYDEKNVLGTADYVAPEQALTATRSTSAPTSTALAAPSTSC